MKKRGIILIGLIILIILIGLIVFVMAADFTPQGNINLRSFYNITNLAYIFGFTMGGNIDANSLNISSADYIDANYFTGNGSLLSGVVGVANTSWNQTYADTLYYDLGNSYTYWNSTFATFNKTYADTLYADISVVTDNSSWNQTHASTLYYAIGNPYSYYNSTDFAIADYYLKSNPYGYWNSTFAIFNKTYADTLYYAIGNPSNFTTNATMNKTVKCEDIVGSPDGDFCADADSGGGGASKWVDGGDYIYPNSTFADNVNVTGNLTVGQGETSFEMYNNGSTIIFDTKGNNSVFTDNMTADYYFGDASQLSNVPGGNSSWNETHADTLYYLITNPYTYWNATFALFNKTYADTLYSTILEPLWTGNQSSYYLKSNPFTYWNSTFAIFNKTYADTIYLNLSGTNVDQNINISPYNITAENYFGVGEELTLSRIGSSTFKNVQDLQNLFHSSGVFNSNNSVSFIVLNAGNTFNVTGGSGTIRANEDATTVLLFFDWSASNNIAISLDEVIYVGVEYNAGSPQVITKSTNTWDSQTEFPLGSVVRDLTGVHLQREDHAIGDHATNMINRLFATLPFSRDNRAGGLILGTSGRNITLTSGTIWEKLNEFPISAIDTSVSDTFDRYYRNGTGGWFAEEDQTNWNNSHYDDGTGTLNDLANNKWSIEWVYLEVDGEIVTVYGQEQFNSQGNAEAASPPSTLPERLQIHSKLIGRIIFQEGTTNATATESIFVTQFTVAGVTDHGNLAGLSDDDHTQYVLADGSRSLTANWNQGAFNLTNTLSWFLGKINHSSVQNHPADFDTNASSACSGTTTYLDGENNCDILEGLSNFTDDLGHVEDNSSWNETHADALYYLITNPYTYWNATFAIFNKTYADTLYYDISDNDLNYWNDTANGINVTFTAATYEPISQAHFNASTTMNITCLSQACDWYTNASDSCMYWPSGGKDCGA